MVLSLKVHAASPPELCVRVIAACLRIQCKMGKFYESTQPEPLETQRYWTIQYPI